MLIFHLSCGILPSAEITTARNSTINNQRLADGLDAIMVQQFFDEGGIELLAFRHEQKSVASHNHSVP
jgi:hypothetical protein